MQIQIKKLELTLNKIFVLSGFNRLLLIPR